MTIEEILSMAATPSAMISELKKGRLTAVPDMKQYIEAIDPKTHEIFDKAKRPDKIIKDGDLTRTEPVARIGLALQKLIVKRSTAFIFGNPVQLVSKAKTDTQKKVFEAIDLIMDDVKINSLNRRIARALFSCTEVAELWYPVELKEDEELLYGIDSKFKLRMRVLDPLKGDVLYPYFDDYGDLIAFSREYKVVKGDKKYTYFETYTDSLIFKYDATEGEPTLIERFPTANAMGKIPIVYGSQQQTDYEDVQGMIDRLEKLLSNFADTNDYHGSPTIFVKGVIKGFSKKGESGKVLEGDKDTTAEYLSWTNAPESVKLEIDTLLKLIHAISQTPDVSFENVKGLGSGISAKALRMMFLDAHLKVEDHMEVFDEYLQRRISILKAFIGSANETLKKEAKNLRIDCVVTPYMIDDESDAVDVIMTATGNKAIMSQKTGIKKSGLIDSEDVEMELAQIQAEEKAMKTIDVFQPTF